MLTIPKNLLYSMEIGFYYCVSLTIQKISLCGRRILYSLQLPLNNTVWDTRIPPIKSKAIHLMAVDHGFEIFN